MSGKDVPYQLRTNKFIDRQIFLDLLSRVIPLKAQGQYVYISMGGKHLVDQEAAYRRLGIRNLYSFDKDEAVVARQEWNKPTSSAVCVEMPSSSLAGEIDSIMHRFAPAGNFVIWLDYTNPADRLSQLQEFTECLKRAESGDVIRITMNAEDFTLRGPWKEERFAGPAPYRAARLKQQIDDYFDATITEIGENQLSSVLAKAVSLACSMAEEQRRTKFAPLLVTSYADGQRMMTATVLALGPGDEIPKGLQDWEFLAHRWTDVLDIFVPDLSLREKLAIDRHLAKGPAAILKRIPFVPANDIDEAREALSSYKKLHRYYPTFFPVGVQ
jgi:hypothetical protein